MYLSFQHKIIYLRYVTPECTGLM